MFSRVTGAVPWRYVLVFLLCTLGLGLWARVVSAGLPGTTSLPEHNPTVAPPNAKGDANRLPAVEVVAPLREGAAMDYRPARPASVLYDQLTTASSNSATSQNFEPARDAYDSQLADDFVVPAGQT